MKREYHKWWTSRLDRNMEFLSHNTEEINVNQAIEISGGGWLKYAYTISSTILKYSSPAGALVSGIGDGILEELTK